MCAGQAAAVDQEHASYSLGSGEGMRLRLQAPAHRQRLDSFDLDAMPLAQRVQMHDKGANLGLPSQPGFAEGIPEHSKPETGMLVPDGKRALRSQLLALARHM